MEKGIVPCACMHLCMYIRAHVCAPVCTCVHVCVWCKAGSVQGWVVFRVSQGRTVLSWILRQGREERSRHTGQSR